MAGIMAKRLVAVQDRWFFIAVGAAGFLAQQITSVAVADRVNPDFAGAAAFYFMVEILR